MVDFVHIDAHRVNSVGESYGSYNSDAQASDATSGEGCQIEDEVEWQTGSALNEGGNQGCTRYADDVLFDESERDDDDDLQTAFSENLDGSDWDRGSCGVDLGGGHQSTSSYLQPTADFTIRQNDSSSSEPQRELWCSSRHVVSLENNEVDQA